jgi:hypothetical protein
MFKEPWCCFQLGQGAWVGEEEWQWRSCARIAPLRVRGSMLRGREGGPAPSDGNPRCELPAAPIGVGIGCRASLTDLDEGQLPEGDVTVRVGSAQLHSCVPSDTSPRGGTPAASRDPRPRCPRLSGRRIQVSQSWEGLWGRGATTGVPVTRNQPFFQDRRCGRITVSIPECGRRRGTKAARSR